jgi:hypothetical protein
MLQRWFDVGEQLVADISVVDSPAVVAELQAPSLIAGFTMRKLQALHLIAQPGFRTTTDVVASHVDGVLRALLEAPRRHLASTSVDVDWDHAWAVLDAGMLLPSDCPEVEAQSFRHQIEVLIAARRAVVALSEKRIQVFG